VRKLVLCSTTPGGAASFPMPEQTVALMGRASHLDPSDALQQFVVNALSPEPPAELVEEIVAYRAANPPDPAGWFAQAGAGAAHDALARLGEIAVPTLVIHGTADNVVDVRNATLLADGIPGSRLALLEGVGHLLPWERPVEFAALVEEFLA
jgi:pimeloyl-ACP methyl ester carboxylesterase